MKILYLLTLILRLTLNRSKMLFLIRRQNPSAFGALLLLLMYQIGANGTLENTSKIRIIQDSGAGHS